ncbi:hypothetical protein CSC2_44260 [Clostridium zeae]|uniref:Teneurin-like YD-shell domain-containing protein n=1 Tax=Clostridium zeae TaxID=2759022 RepID=A0ABQ1EH02_9CLOT|nr:RHS repeat-associated core domain-containing protein [Clostridium zeae]GFZ33900.1 hypothetical protein CSC2_44260 [Clostridium zeae]
MDRITNVSKSVEGQTVNNSYSYQNDKLATITHNGFSYSFGYDSLGNNTTIQVGNQNLITNSYDNKTGRLDKVTYGNGQIISQIYDNSDRIVKKQYNGSDRFTYDYDGFGNRVAKVDIVNGVNYKYQYDLGNRLLKTIDSVGNATSFIYDGNSNNKGITEVIGGKTFDTAYQYDKDNRIKSIGYTRNSSNTVSYTYDSVGRITNNAISTGTATYNTSLGYATGINGSSFNLISSITNNSSKISYTYDKNGNIDTINDGGKLIKYYYNELDELKREDNQVLNKTIVYSYDTGGNILSKVEYPYTTGTVSAATKTYAYAYGDANWNDKLTSYDGKAITYDTIGNPLTYNGWTFTWEEGRQLKSMNGNSYNISYKYNDEGIRTEKNVNGVVTKYHLVDDRVTYESNGTDTIYYTYDDSNSLVSMNLNGIEYYYIKNVQGDIIGLFDKSGTQVVNYTYDSWGKLVTIGGTLASTLGVKNPYRYRGYRYDTETGLYYLQSRYNAEWGRFVNADEYSILQLAQGELIKTNLFTYCENNPVNSCDPTGMFRISVFWASVILDGALYFLVPYFVGLYNSAKLTYIVRGFKAFKSVKDSIARSISNTLYDALDRIVYNLRGRAANAVTKSVTRKWFADAVSDIIGNIISWSPGYIVAKIIDICDRDGNSGSIYF